MAFVAVQGGHRTRADAGGRPGTDALMKPQLRPPSLALRRLLRLRSNLSGAARWGRLILTFNTHSTAVVGRTRFTGSVDLVPDQAGAAHATWLAPPRVCLRELSRNKSMLRERR